MSAFLIKRIYEKSEAGDGYRMLVDRIWPRGISKEKAKLDEWNKEIAPSADLRKWFNHEPEKFEEFRKRYKEELKEKTDDLHRIKELAKEKQICLLYGAKDEKHNQAIVIKEVLEKL